MNGRRSRFLLVAALADQVGLYRTSVRSLGEVADSFDLMKDPIGKRFED